MHLLQICQEAVKLQSQAPHLQSCVAVRPRRAAVRKKKGYVWLDTAKVVFLSSYRAAISTFCEKEASQQWAGNN